METYYVVTIIFMLFLATLGVMAFWEYLFRYKSKLNRIDVANPELYPDTIKVAYKAKISLLERDILLLRSK